MDDLNLVLQDVDEDVGLYSGRVRIACLVVVLVLILAVVLDNNVIVVIIVGLGLVFIFFGLSSFGVRCDLKLFG